jgi:hypothetical protein
MATQAPTTRRPDRHDPPRGKASTRRRRGFQVTPRDRELLAFVAAHRFVLASQVQAWLGPCMSVCYRRLQMLTDAGLLSYRRIFHAEPGCYQVTNGGLGLAGSGLPRPQVDLHTYGHDAGLVWLWLAAADGAFGPTRRLLSEREMRHLDWRAESSAQRFGLLLPGVDRYGRQRIHYPDVLVVLLDGTYVALELELSLKSRRRLEEIFLAYGVERRLRAVVYVTDRRTVARALHEQTAAYGLDDLVDVRYFEGRPRSDYWMDWPRQALREAP